MGMGQSWKWDIIPDDESMISFLCSCLFFLFVAHYLDRDINDSPFLPLRLTWDLFLIVDQPVELDRFGAQLQPFALHNILGGPEIVSFRSPQRNQRALWHVGYFNAGVEARSQILLRKMRHMDRGIAALAAADLKDATVGRCR